MSCAKVGQGLDLMLLEVFPGINDPVIQSSFPETNPGGGTRGCQPPAPLSCAVSQHSRGSLSKSSCRAGGDGLVGPGLLCSDLGLLLQSWGRSEWLLLAGGNRRIPVFVGLGFGQLSLELPGEGWKHLQSWCQCSTLGDGSEEVWVLCVITSALTNSDLFDCSCDIGFPSSHALI